MSRRKGAELTREMNLAQLYLDITGGLIVAINSDEIVIDINKTGSEMLGYPKYEITGKNYFDTFIPERDRESLRNSFHQMLAEKTLLEYIENPVITRDGRELMINWHNILIKDSNGYVIGILCSGEDITERKQRQISSTQYRDHLEASIANRTADYAQANAQLELAQVERDQAQWGLQFRDAMLENIPDPIFLIDISGNLIYANKAGCATFEFERSRMIGLSFWELVQPQSRQVMEIAQRELTEKREKREYQFETYYIKKDGNRVDLWFHSRVITTLVGAFILTQIRDISQQKRMEQQLKLAESQIREITARNPHG